MDGFCKAFCDDSPSAYILVLFSCFQGFFAVIYRLLLQASSLKKRDHLRGDTDLTWQYDGGILFSLLGFICASLAGLIGCIICTARSIFWHLGVFSFIQLYGAWLAFRKDLRGGILDLHLQYLPR